MTPVYDTFSLNLVYKVVKKKRVMISVILNDKNLLILQNMDFLNARGKSTGRKNLNEFINRCIADKIGIDSPEENNKLLERLILSEIKEIKNKRDKREQEESRQLKLLAIKLSDLRKQQGLDSYFKKEEKKEILSVSYE